MGKIKIKRKSTTLDMTAMCDVAFLLLTFFMLTTKFRPPEPLTVDIPSSVVQSPTKDKDMMVISIGSDGRAFMDFDQQPIRKEVLGLMGEKYGVKFTPEELQVFSIIGPYGVPMNQMKQFLNMAPNDRDAFNAKSPGIPVDTLSDFSRCELFDWVISVRRANPKSVIALKGDVDTKYPALQTIIAILQKQNANKFSFVTNLEANPLTAKKK